MIVWFDKSAIEKITTPTNARAAIASLDAIINTLIAAAGAAALNAGVKEYSFDDGMTKTKMEYRDMSAITAQIRALQALQQIYLQMPGMNNRVIRLCDKSQFPNYFPNFY
jgi:hypothetical protein